MIKIKETGYMTYSWMDVAYTVLGLQERKELKIKNDNAFSTDIKQYHEAK